jgi:hypothetical protein
MNIQDLSTQELKVIVYDHSMLMQKLQAEINIINQEISSRIEQPKPVVEKPKKSVKSIGRR